MTKLMKLNKKLLLTFCLFHKGFSDMPAAVFRSFSRPYADRESHATPYVTNNLPLAVILKTQNEDLDSKLYR